MAVAKFREVIKDCLNNSKNLELLGDNRNVGIAYLNYRFLALAVDSNYPRESPAPIEAQGLLKQAGKFAQFL